MKALIFIFSLLLVLLIAGLWIGPGSYPDKWRLDERIVVQEQKNTEKKEQIKKIQAELEDVTSGKEALEERARSELGMTKKGETFFEVIMQPETKKPKQNVVNEDTVKEPSSSKSEKQHDKTVVLPE